MGPWRVVIPFNGPEQHLVGLTPTPIWVPTSYWVILTRIFKPSPYGFPQASGELLKAFTHQGSVQVHAVHLHKHSYLSRLTAEYRCFITLHRGELLYLYLTCICCCYAGPYELPIYFLLLPDALYLIMKPSSRILPFKVHSRDKTLELCAQFIAEPFFFLSNHTKPMPVISNATKSCCTK